MCCHIVKTVDLSLLGLGCTFKRRPTSLVNRMVICDLLDLPQERVEERRHALSKKMAAPEYGHKTPAKIKEADMDNLSKAQKEILAIEQQIDAMHKLSVTNFASLSLQSSQ